MDKLGLVVVANVSPKEEKIVIIYLGVSNDC